MDFIKMHGIGNDYVYIDCFRQRAPEDPCALAIEMARPHFGIGSDGLILIMPSKTADARMRMFNADGSEGKMCGNGVRCVAKYLYDSGLCRRETISVETLAGIRAIRMQIHNGVATGATVDMGKPRFDPANVPVTAKGTTALDMLIDAAGHTFRCSCLGVGNAHCVIFGDLPDDELFYRAGPVLEKHPVFPEGANIEWNQVIDLHRLRMRVWERGSGETMACGTGATASAVAAVQKGLCVSPVTVELPGGALDIAYDGVGNAFMTGPAEIVFTGCWQKNL